MSAADIHIPRKLWTRVEVKKIDPVLAESLELIHGDLIDTMGKKPPHVYWKHALFDWLSKQFGFEYVRSEDPIDVSPEDNSTNEPEPDLAVTKQSIRVTRGVNPKPADLRLVVEVSDTTYDLDRKVKACLYDRAGIEEYWIVDIRKTEAPRLLVHREPQDGSYRVLNTYSHTAVAEVLSGRRLCLKDLL